MSQSKKTRGQILNCQQNYFRGEYIPAISVVGITPENALARKARRNNPRTKRDDQGIEI